MFSSSSGLDHQLQAFHAQDGYAVTSCEEHLKEGKHIYSNYKPPLAKSNIYIFSKKGHIQRNCFFFSKGRLWNTSQKSLMVGWSFQYSPLYSVLWRERVQKLDHWSMMDQQIFLPTTSVKGKDCQERPSQALSSHSWCCQSPWLAARWAGTAPELSHRTPCGSLHRSTQRVDPLMSWKRSQRMRWQTLA